MSHDAYNAVLLNVGFDRTPPVAPESCLRFNDARSTYTQKFAAASMDVYQSMEALEATGADLTGKTVMQFLEFADAGESAELTPRRLVFCNDKQQISTILYDDKNILSDFKSAFGLRNQSVLVLQQTQPKYVERRPGALNTSSTVYETPRGGDVPVLTFLSFRHDGAGRVSCLNFKAENSQHYYDNAFDILPPGSRDGADFILEIMPDLLSIDADGALHKEENRLFLRNIKTGEEALFFDDRKLQTYQFFRDRCSALRYGAGLKSLTCVKTPKAE